MNVLFVDDEPKMLRAIERSLSSLHDDWHMYFSQSAEQAWKVLERESIDVVVSDMQMPDTDGADFLAAVSRRAPEVARLILSGFNNEDASVRSTASAHRFLAKPISGNELAQEIMTAALGAEDDFGRNIINSMNRLPTPSLVKASLLEALSESDVVVADVLSIVKADPALTAKVLQLGNSAFFGEHTVTHDVTACLRKLGIDTLNYLAETQNLVESSDMGGGATDALIAEIQDHATASGDTAGTLAIGDPDLAYLGGLLHVTGRLIYAHHGVGVTPAAVGHGCADDTNRDLGTMLLTLWGLPATVVQAARDFHCTTSK